MNRSLLIYTPLLVFSLIWGVTFSLYLLNPFQLKPINGYTWLVVISGLSMVLLGFISAKLLSEGITITQPINKNHEFPFDLTGIKKFILIATTISLLGKIGTTYLIAKEVGGIDTFFVTPGFVRNFIKDTQYGNTSVSLFQYKMLSYVGSLLPINIILAGVISNLRKSWFYSLYPLTVAAFASVMTLQRVYFIKQYVIWLICSFIIIYFYPSLKQKEALKIFVKRVVYFLLISIIFLFLVVFLRSIFDPGAKLEKLYNSFYFYIVGNIYWLDIYLSYDNLTLMGASIFRSFIKWLVLFGVLDKESIIAPHYEFYRLYNTMGNTFTYIRVPYEDFKLIGVIVISYFWGMLSFFCIKEYIKKFTFVRLGFSALLILSLFWSFYGFNLIHITAWIWQLMLLSIIDKMYLKKQI